ncbi:MAG: peptidylprolyl isomerase [Bacteroidota bacterium]
MKKIFFITLLASYSIFGQEVLDKIVAIVDNEIVLKSELDFQVALAAAQKNLDPKDEKIRRQIIEGMIIDKLLYAQAELDSITVTDEEVDQQLDMQMNYFIQQYGSRERVESTYGMSIEKIKREFRNDTRKNMMAERVKMQKFGTIDVSRREVTEFFNSYKDSLGVIPEKFNISHIFINPTQTEKVRKRAKDLANSLLDSIKLGSDFAELAKKFSDDPGSAAQGGDLGSVKRGVFFPEFESVAYSLKRGQLSDVVESPVGFHIIQLIDRKGESIHTRHILVKIKNDDEADLKSIEFLTELRDSITKNENTFVFYAKKYSDDKETAGFGGELGNFEISQLDKSLLDQVYKLKEGEIGFPKRLQVNPTTYGFHIVKLTKRTPQHSPTIEEDFEEIKKLAQFQKREKNFREWVEELKQQLYWEIKI